jgi:hypothetical protein
VLFFLTRAPLAQLANEWVFEGGGTSSNPGGSICTIFFFFLLFVWALGPELLITPPCPFVLLNAPLGLAVRTPLLYLFVLFYLMHLISFIFTLFICYILCLTNIKIPKTCNVCLFLFISYMSKNIKNTLCIIYLCLNPREWVIVYLTSCYCCPACSLVSHLPQKNQKHSKHSKKNLFKKKSFSNKPRLSSRELFQIFF